MFARRIPLLPRHVSPSVTTSLLSRHSALAVMAWLGRVLFMMPAVSVVAKEVPAAPVVTASRTRYGDVTELI